MSLDAESLRLDRSPITMLATKYIASVGVKRGARMAWDITTGEFILSVGTVLLSGVGAWLAHSYRRRMRLELAQARRDVYSSLWALTGIAAPSRIDTRGRAGLLADVERKVLFEEMTAWYYQGGNGLLLGGPTQKAFLTAKANLVCESGKLKPEGVLSDLKADFASSKVALCDEELRGLLSIRQLSLLRTLLKSDLAVFGRPMVNALPRHQRRFLQHCGVSMARQPWIEIAVDGRENVDMLVPGD